MTDSQRVSPPAALGYELSVKTGAPLVVVEGSTSRAGSFVRLGLSRREVSTWLWPWAVERYVKTVPLPVGRDDRTTGGVACLEHFH